MAELISKWEVVDKLTALENELQQYKPFTEREREIYRKVAELEMTVGKAPAVEAEPVVHAYWERFKHPSGTHGIRCSRCNVVVMRKTIRCPWCGAHMNMEVADGTR